MQLIVRLKPISDERAWMYRLGWPQPQPNIAVITLPCRIGKAMPDGPLHVGQIQLYRVRKHPSLELLNEGDAAPIRADAVKALRPHAVSSNRGSFKLHTESGKTYLSARSIYCFKTLFSFGLRAAETIQINERHWRAA